MQKNFRETTKQDLRSSAVMEASCPLQRSFFQKFTPSFPAPQTFGNPCGPEAPTRRPDRLSRLLVPLPPGPLPSPKIRLSPLSGGPRDLIPCSPDHHANPRSLTARRNASPRPPPTGTPHLGIFSRGRSALPLPPLSSTSAGGADLCGPGICIFPRW